MTKILLFIFSFFTLTNISFGQQTKTETLKVATASDTTENYFTAGFYLTIPDVSKAHGFKLLNSDEFYYIGTEYGVTLRNLDTVYKEFDRNFKLYVLTFKFDTTGTKELLDFSMKYQGQKIGLLLDNKLISVATIPTPIGYGVMTLAGKFTEEEIDTLKIEIDQATRETKMRRGTIRRKTK
jgi:preprotein translocase subunit SecD